MSTHCIKAQPPSAVPDWKQWRHAGGGVDRDLLCLQVLNTLMEKSPENGVRGMPHILPAIIAKLSAAKSSVLIVNLLAVCARLVNINATQFIDFLASASSPSAPLALHHTQLGFFKARRAGIKSDGVTVTITSSFSDAPFMQRFLSLWLPLLGNSCRWILQFHSLGHTHVDPICRSLTA